MPDDLKLWNLMRDGDSEAFERFYREHVGALQGFLRRYVGDSKFTEDIAQEAFLQLWRHPNGFRPGRGSLRAYLFGIAVKRAADWWRHRPPEVALQHERAIQQGNLPHLMADTFQRLDPDKRSLLWLREVEGYSYEELSEILEIPLGTVRSRLFAAREQLRRIWNDGKIPEDL